MKKETRKVILLLDSAKCHEGEQITEALKDTKIEIVRIPGGCTSFLQLLDTSIFKGLKDKIKRKYLEWLEKEQEKYMHNKGVHEITVDKDLKVQLQGPEFMSIREWLASSLAQIDKQLIINSFGSCGITYGISDLVHVNKQLTENWNRILIYLESSTSKEDEYLDKSEGEIKFTL